MSHLSRDPHRGPFAKTRRYWSDPVIHDGERGQEATSQRINRWVLDTGDSGDGETKLLKISATGRAIVEMAVKALSRGRIEGVVEVVRDEFDELLTANDAVVLCRSLPDLRVLNVTTCKQASSD